VAFATLELSPYLSDVTM